MDIIKKHVDTVIVLGGIVGSLLWMNGKFSDLNDRFTNQFHELKQEIVMIKTVLIMKNILSNELAIKEEIK